MQILSPNVTHMERKEKCIMKHLKQILCMLLAVCLLAGILPAGAVEAHAAELSLGLSPLEGEYQPMQISQNMVDVIKSLEGFHPEPYWDHSQWSIGYGTSCGSDPDNKPDITLTEAEASEELIRVLNENYSPSVNRFCRRLDKQPSQQQFDALVDFTFNLGSSWMDGCRLSRWLENPTTALELVDAMGAWCRAGGAITYQLAARRVRDALAFLHGEYYLMQAPKYYESDLPVIGNSDLPRYKFVRFIGNGGSYGSHSDEIQYYNVDAPMESFPIPEWSGHTLSGWQVVAASNYDLDTPYTITPQDRIGHENLEIEAQWDGDTCVLRFETNGGSHLNSVTAARGSLVDLTPYVPVREGYDFAGWYEDDGLVNPIEVVTMHRDWTVYAKWTPQEPEVPEVPEAPVNPFVDVPEDAYYRDAVLWAVEKGITSGTGSDTFEPNRSSTRAQAMTFLWSAAGKPEPAGSEPLPFTDVKESDYFAKAVRWAVEQGITSGISDTVFGSDEPCTRGQIVTFLWAYGGKQQTEGDTGFTDVPANAFYAPAVRWAVRSGITTGSSDTTFSPDDACTRAQIVVFLHRYLGE